MKGSRKKMKDLTIKATTAFPDGGIHSQENVWTGIVPEFSAYMTKVLLDAADRANALGHKGGPLTLTLSMTCDGVKQPDLVVHGLTRKNLTKLQKHAHKM